MIEVGLVILGVVVFLAFFAFADNVTEKDRAERMEDDDTDGAPPT